MFIERSTPCVTTPRLGFPEWGMAELHASMRRLYEATGATSQAELASCFNVSAQRINNLERRGISKDLALQAQAERGISATWLLYGSEPAMILSQSARPDPSILANTARVLHNIALMQAGESAFDWTPEQCVAVYEALSRLSPDVDIDRAEVSRRMAAVLRGVRSEETVGRTDVVGAR